MGLEITDNQIKTNVLHRLKKNLNQLVENIIKELENDLTNALTRSVKCVVLNPSKEELKIVNPDPIGETITFYERNFRFDKIIQMEKSRKLIFTKNNRKINRKIRKIQINKNAKKSKKVASLEVQKISRNKMSNLKYLQVVLKGKSEIQKILFFLQSSHLYFRVLTGDFQMMSCRNFFFYFMRLFKEQRVHISSSELRLVAKFFVYWIYLSFSRGFITKKINPLIFHKVIFGKEQ